MSRLPVVKFNRWRKYSSIWVLWLSGRKAATFFIAIQMGEPQLYPTPPERTWLALLFAKSYARSKSRQKNSRIWSIPSNLVPFNPFTNPLSGFPSPKSVVDSTTVVKGTSPDFVRHQEMSDSFSSQGEPVLSI